MIVKNLSQLKKAISAKTPFRIVEHYIKPEFSGQVRLPNVIQTNGFYSVEDGKPDSKVSQANYGKGYWLDYGKASEWTFDGEYITRIFSNGEKCFTICFY
jgi:hypothetical protein